MAKYLDQDGLLYFWQQLKTKLAGKVDVERGKGLSTNDFTTADQTKLNGIATGAEVNVIDGITVNGTAATVTNKMAAIATPTRTSDLINDGDGTSDFATEAYVAENGGKIDTVSVNGSAQTITDKNVNINVPTQTSQLTNDSGFITGADVPEGAAASTTVPRMDGTAAVGTEMAFARGDHVHPTDTSRAPLASPAFTGAPTAPTATAGTNTTQIATTEFVTGALGGYVTTATAESTYATKSEVASAMDYKGSVASVSDLPSTGNENGDVYNVTATDMNYAWDGTAWDPLGSTFTIESITNGDIDTIMAA